MSKSNVQKLAIKDVITEDWLIEEVWAIEIIKRIEKLVNMKDLIY